MRAEGGRQAVRQSRKTPLYIILRAVRSNWCNSSQLVSNNNKRNLITSIRFQTAPVSSSLALWSLLLTAIDQ